jgi:hypothetical protein
LPSKEVHGITVLSGGSVVPGYSVVELSTIASHRLVNQDWGDKFLQIFLARTPNHFLGVHNRGRVSTIQKRQFSSREFVLAKNQVQSRLKALKKALVSIQEIVMPHSEEAKMSLVYDGIEMKVYQRDEGSDFLPDALVREFTK